MGFCSPAVPVLAVLPDVGDVQERGAFEADLDKGTLHAGQHARDATEVDVADQAARTGALDVQLLHHALLEHGDARFLRCHIDEDFVHVAADFTVRAGLSWRAPRRFPPAASPSLRNNFPRCG